MTPSKKIRLIQPNTACVRCVLMETPVAPFVASLLDQTELV